MNLFLPLVAVAGIAALATSGTAQASVPSEPLDDTYTPYLDDPMKIETDDQLDAFRHLIRDGESSNNYGAYVGGGTFTDYSHHPALPPTNWPGVNGSRACGAYQAQPGTWLDFCKATGHGGSFDPISQDLFANWCIIRRHAYAPIVAGDIATACELLKNEWQIFTLPAYTPDRVANSFENYGGTLA